MKDNPQQIDKDAVKQYLLHCGSFVTPCRGWTVAPGTRIAGPAKRVVVAAAVWWMARLLKRAKLTFPMSLAPDARSATERPELAGRSFEAMGVSLVIHPQNPCPHLPRQCALLYR